MQTAPRATKSRWLVPAIVLAAGLAVRLAPWPHVFANGEVILRADTDPHYHVLRAERLLNHAPGAPWVDPWLGWPAGAEVPWPPLFDATIAAAARLFSAAPSRDQLARAGALLVVVWGMITLPLVAALGRRLTGRGGAGWVAAAFVALIPAVVQHSEVGRVDQHGAELMLFTAILLAFVTAAQEPARATRCGVVLGLLFALAFWTWLGSAVLLAFPAAFAGLWYVMAPRGEVAARAGVRAVAVGGGVGALLLVISVSVLGPPDALLRGSLLGVSGLHVTMVGGVGVFGALLLVARRWPPLEVSRVRRAAVVATAVALPIALSLGFSDPLRDGVREGLTAFAAGNPWYASVGEFKPLLLTGDRPISSELLGVVGSFGLTIPLALLAIPAWRSRLRTGSPAWPVSFEALLLVVFTGLAFARQRFMGYATIPISLAGAAGLDWLAGRLPQRVRDRPLGRPLAFAAGVALCVVPVLPEYGLPWSAVPPQEVQALRWLSSQPARHGREGVLSPWSMGHAVQYFAGRPAVASPFGTEGGHGSMERWARFWYATDQSSAEAALGQARVGVVVLDSPLGESLGCFGLAPPGTPPAMSVHRDFLNGRRSEMTAAAMSHVVFQLYLADGLRFPGGGPALDAFQLQYESPPTSNGPVKIFGWVPGARVTVTGLRPFAEVDADVQLTTNQGRRLGYGTSGRASAAGTAMLRLPYGTGRNGLVEAGAWTVSSGGHAVRFDVPVAAVTEGGGSTIALR